VRLLLEVAGFLAVVGAFAAAGNLVAASYRARTVQLAAFRTGLDLLETEVTFAAASMPVALERVGAGLAPPVGTVFQRAAAYLRSGAGLSAGEAWERAARDLFPDTALERDDLDVLLALTPYLGVTDREDQRRHLRLAAERLRAREEAARAEQGAAERMWRYLGVLGGLACGLVFL